MKNKITSHTKFLAQALFLSCITGDYPEGMAIGIFTWKPGDIESSIPADKNFCTGEDDFV
jgi:hypothetical protein